MGSPLSDFDLGNKRTTQFLGLFWPRQGSKVMQLLQKLSRGAFCRNVLVVMSGTAFAQAIAIAFSPVLSRLYDPAHFGIFGTYLSITAVLGAAATFNYTDALMLPKEDQDAAPLFLLSCLGTLGLASVTLLWCLFAPERWLRVVGMGNLGALIWFLPISLLLLGANQALTSWSTRVKAFKETSKAQVFRSLAACAGQGAGGTAGLGAVGLIGGAVLGDGWAAACLSRSVLRQSAAAFRASFHWEILRQKAREFRDFALYGCPQNTMNALSQGLPVLVLAHFYGVTVAGLYAFGIRVLQVPMNFVLTALRQVLFQRLSQLQANQEDIYRPFLKSTGILMAVSVVPAVLGFLIAPPLFAFVFGEQWRTAGEFARWLIFWYWPAFCNVPSSLAARILRLQKNLFLFDLGLLASRAAALVVGGVWFAPLPTIIALSLVGSFFNIGFIIYIAVRVRRTSRALVHAGTTISV